MAAVLKPRKDFEDLLGAHSNLEIPKREYTVLADDMRLNPNYSFSLGEARLLEAKAIQRRHFWDSVRMTASAQGIPLHEVAVAKVVHGVATVDVTLDLGHGADRLEDLVVAVARRHERVALREPPGALRETSGSLRELFGSSPGTIGGSQGLS